MSHDFWDFMVHEFFEIHGPWIFWNSWSMNFWNSMSHDFLPLGLIYTPRPAPRGRGLLYDISLPKTYRPKLLLWPPVWWSAKPLVCPISSRWWVQCLLDSSHEFDWFLKPLIRPLSTWSWFQYLLVSDHQFWMIAKPFLRLHQAGDGFMVTSLNGLWNHWFVPHLAKVGFNVF